MILPHLLVTQDGGRHALYGPGCPADLERVVATARDEGRDLWVGLGYTQRVAAHEVVIAQAGRGLDGRPGPIFRF